MKEINEVLSKRCYDTDDLPDKIIRSVVYDSEGLTIAFTDNSFLFIKPIRDYDDGIDISIDESMDTYLLVKAGLISRDIYNKAEEEKKTQALKENEEIDRKLYDKLKTRFEKDPS